MKRTLRSILALTLAICSMLGSLSALAETVCVMQSATVYATPGDASSAVGTLPAGTDAGRGEERLVSGAAGRQHRLHALGGSDRAQGLQGHGLCPERDGAVQELHRGLG